MNIFIFGLGYSARAAAKAIRAQFGDDIPITGTIRSEDKIKQLQKDGIEALLLEEANAIPIAHAINEATHIIHSVPPNKFGDPVFERYLAPITHNRDLRHLIYLSTIGVYGNAEGAWIDEKTPCKPTSPRGEWRVAAEDNWRRVAEQQNLPLTILRLAGIYGPGRSTFDKLANKTAKRIIKPGQVFNRIHVDDIGQVCALAAEKCLNGTFNLTDDEPAPPQDVVTLAAKMIEKRAPKQVDFAEADMTEMARSFYADNKRVSNAAIKKALGFELRHPTYREGLEAILKFIS